MERHTGAKSHTATKTDRRNLWKDCFDEVEMLEGCRMMRRASICFSIRQFQFAKVIDQQILFDLNSNKQWDILTSMGRYIRKA